MNTIVTTNLRIPEDQYIQLKHFASEKGLSVNEYVNQLITATTTRDQLMPTSKDDRKRQSRGKKYSLWDLPALMAKIPAKPEKFSEIDKAIYDL